MSSSGPERYSVASGLQLRLGLPEAARDISSEGLPAVDLSAIAGARLTLRRGIEADGLELHALCATAPSGRWVPGVEELVLDRASGLARAALSAPGTRIERWDAGTIHQESEHLEQSFEGERRSPTQVAVSTQVEPAPRIHTIRGKHLLGFAGDEHAAVLCTVLCLESGPPTRCDALVDAAAIEGSFVSAPEPSLFIQAILIAAERPYPTTAALALVASASVALLLAHRPRPRP